MDEKTREALEIVYHLTRHILEPYDHKREMEALAHLQAMAEENERLRNGLPSEKIECPSCGKVFVHTEERLYNEEYEKENAPPKVSVTREWLYQTSGELSTFRFSNQHPEVALAWLGNVLRSIGITVEEEK